MEPNTTAISVVTIGEIRRGIESVRRRDARSGESIERWLNNLIADYREHLLPVDLPVAEEWGRMNVSTTLPVIDGLLAATAKIHGLILATRNVKDVSRTGIQVVNPFEA